MAAPDSDWWWVGYDVGLFGGAGRAVLVHGPAACDLAALVAQLRPLLTYYVPGDYLIMPFLRGLLATLLPATATPVAVLLTAILLALTLGALLPCWRGTGLVRGPRFPERLLATVVVTLLVGYHPQHPGGALLVPAAAPWRSAEASRTLRALLLLGFVAPNDPLFSGYPCGQRMQTTPAQRSPAGAFSVQPGESSPRNAAQLTPRADWSRGPALRSTSGPRTASQQLDPRACAAHPG